MASCARRMESRARRMNSSEIDLRPDHELFIRVRAKRACVDLRLVSLICVDLRPDLRSAATLNSHDGDDRPGRAQRALALARSHSGPTVGPFRVTVGQRTAAGTAPPSPA